MTGWIKSGMISFRGVSTKFRCVSLGWGTVRRVVLMIWESQKKDIYIYGSGTKLRTGTNPSEFLFRSLTFI